MPNLNSIQTQRIVSANHGAPAHGAMLQLWLFLKVILALNLNLFKSKFVTSQKGMFGAVEMENLQLILNWKFYKEIRASGNRMGI